MSSITNRIGQQRDALRSTRKHVARRATSKPARARPAASRRRFRLQPVLYRFCKSGWAVLVEKQPSQQGTRFVCPFCPLSHRVSGPCGDSARCGARSGSSCAGWTSRSTSRVERREKRWHARSKRAVCRRPPAREGRGAERAQRKEGREDLVAPLDDRSGHDRPHHCRAQRQEIHPGVYHRADDRAQAGRVCPDAHLQGPRRARRLSKGRREWRARRERRRRAELAAVRRTGARKA